MVLLLHSVSIEPESLLRPYEAVYTQAINNLNTHRL
jgi:hypothetical protein